MFFKAEVGHIEKIYREKNPEKIAEMNRHIKILLS